MEVIVDTTKGVYREQIVRCRDCRKKRSCITFEGIANENGFCSLGEIEASGEDEQTEREKGLKRGKWIWGNEKKSWHKCSVCGEQAYSYYDELAGDVEELFDYCPYCGAEMREREGE